MEAIALQEFSDLRHGTVAAGQRFSVSPEKYRVMVGQGLCRPLTLSDSVAPDRLEAVDGFDRLPVMIVASGPSLTRRDCNRLIKARKADQCRVIVVNDNWRMVPNADLLYACDTAWWDRYHAEIEFDGVMYTQTPEAARKYGLRYVAGKSGPGLCLDPGVIHTGGNSGYQAIGLAYHLGARRIALLGFDMQHTNDKRHWFGDHPEGLTNAARVDVWVKNYEPLASDLQAQGVQVVNCTRQTALHCFERLGFNQWIKTLPAN